MLHVVERHWPVASAEHFLVRPSHVRPLPRVERFVASRPWREFPHKGALTRLPGTSYNNRRQGGDATDQLTQRAQQLATTGQFCWPPTGSSTVRHWADPTGR